MPKSRFRRRRGFVSGARGGLPLPSLATNESEQPMIDIDFSELLGPPPHTVRRPIHVSSPNLAATRYADELLDAYSSWLFFERHFLHIGRFGVAKALGMIDTVVTNNALKPRLAGLRRAGPPSGVGAGRGRLASRPPCAANARGSLKSRA